MCYNIKGMGMLVDLIPGDMREQGFPVMAAFSVAGPVIVYAVAYKLLAMHWTHYTSFWIIMLVTDFFCLGFQLTLLPESLPDELKKPLKRE